MRKCLYLLSCLILSTGVAKALSTGQQLNAMKDLFTKEFQKIDTNAEEVNFDELRSKKHKKD